MPGNNYSVDGNVEWLVACNLVDMLKYNMDMNAITANVRVAGDTTDGRVMPGIAVSVVSDATVRNCNEYKCGVQFHVESDATVDTTGEQNAALVGIVRDIIHADDFVTDFNTVGRDVVLHGDGWEEGETFPENEEKNKVRRMILQLDLWVYPGRVTE